MKGLGYLSQQQQADGSFTGLDEPGPRITPVAQVLLAFLSTGQTPAVGRYAFATRNAIEFIVNQLPDDGDFGRADGSGLYGQAIVTIALAEIYGLDTDAARRELLKNALKKSLAVIVATQDSRNDCRKFDEMISSLSNLLTRSDVVKPPVRRQIAWMHLRQVGWDLDLIKPKTARRIAEMALKNMGENPTEIVLTDPAMILNFIL